MIITIGEDLDGFLGSDSKVIEMIDIKASQEDYEMIVEKRIKDMHPQITEVNFVWGGESDFSKYGDQFDQDWLREDLEYIEEVVYNMGNFWVYKE